MRYCMSGQYVAFILLDKVDTMLLGALSAVQSHSVRQTLGQLPAHCSREETYPAACLWCLYKRSHIKDTLTQ